MGTNYMNLQVNEMINLFVKLYQKNFESQPTKMLWGPPGIGKSQGIKEFAKKLQNVTGKKTVVTVASLLLMSPIDLRGIPVKHEDEKTKQMVAKWLIPDIFKMDKSDDVINVLFLDEISSAPPSVQAAAYQIALDKRIGEHELPKNCLCIAAGNRTTDKSVAYKMPKALGNRMTHYEIEPSIEDWKIWALNNKIDNRIVSFLMFKPDLLMSFNPNTDDVAFPSPRSWEMVSIYLQCGTVDEMFKSVAGSIGIGAAKEFKTFLNVYTKIPKFSDIIEQKIKSCEQSIQNSPDVMFALLMMIVNNVHKFSETIDEHSDEDLKKAANFVSIISHFIDTISKKEYVAMVLRDLFRSCPTLTNTFIKDEIFSDHMDGIAEYMS